MTEKQKLTIGEIRKGSLQAPNIKDLRIDRITTEFKNYHKQKLQSLVKIECKNKETFDLLFSAVNNILKEELDNLNKESSEWVQNTK